VPPPIIEEFLKIPGGAPDTPRSLSLSSWDSRGLQLWNLANYVRASLENRQFSIWRNWKTL